MVLLLLSGGSGAALNRPRRKIDTRRQSAGTADPSQHVRPRGPRARGPRVLPRTRFQAAADGLDPDPDAFVPFRRFAQMLEDAARELGDPCLGLRVGLATHPRDIGPLGFVLLNSPTVGAAVDNLVRYLGFHQTGAEVTAKEDRGYWRLAYRVLHPGASEFYQDAECTIGTLVAGMTHIGA